MTGTDTKRQISGVQTWYNLVAEGFRHRYEGMEGAFWKCFEEDLALELLGGKKRHILDMGCGPGRLAHSLGKTGQCIVGIDISQAMITLAQNRSHPANVRYMVMDATHTSFESGYFDAVISLGMFEYLSDPTPFLSEIHRLLQPGGQLILTCHTTGGNGFYQWWTLPNRLSAKIRRYLIPGQSNPATGLYFGYSLALRDQLYDKARHAPQSMAQYLSDQGFTEIEYRGLLYPPSISLFSCAAGLPGHRLQTITISAARRLDRWLGSAGARANATVTMFAATKAAEVWHGR